MITFYLPIMFVLQTTLILLSNIFFKIVFQPADPSFPQFKK
jgi:hypothetical protein